MYPKDFGEPLTFHWSSNPRNTPDIAYEFMFLPIMSKILMHMMLCVHINYTLATSRHPFATPVPPELKIPRTAFAPQSCQCGLSVLLFLAIVGIFLIKMSFCTDIRSVEFSCQCLLIVSRVI